MFSNVQYNGDRSALKQQKPRADTVLKPSATFASTHIPTKAIDVNQMVLQELQRNSYVADTDAFLKSLLNVEQDVVGKIYKNLVQKGDYNPDAALWRGFPTSHSSEHGLYAPFTAAANAVNDACAELESPAAAQIKSSWLDRHNTAPKSQGSDAPMIRPDVVCALGARTDIDILEEKICKEEEAEVERMLKLGNKQSDDDTESSKEVADLAKVWWHRVHVPVEVKLKDEDEAAVRQLCGYMRQVFREQLDRRFALGLAFCASELSVWLCDRSGLIGTQTPFDIHTEPKKFIQVIAALALLPPERLGYDLSMTLYRPHADVRFVHSWDPSVTTADFDPKARPTHWAFEMPSRDGTKRERFISVRGLNVVLGEIMCGRATLVWEVVKEDSEDLTRYVLKQCWRPMTSRRESYFYENARLDDSDAALNVGAVYSSEDVHVDTEQDSTLAIRRGLTVLSRSLDDAPTIGKRTREDARDPFVFIKTTHGGVSRFSAPQADDPNPRVLSRMVMETYGWPIKFFKNILELLEAMRDSIRGHQALYYAGVLHRDISANNILICPEDDIGQKTHGTLIDLDYAKFTEEFLPATPIVTRQDWDDGAKRKYLLIYPTFDVNITEEAFYGLWIQYKRNFNGVSNYMFHALELREDLRNLNRPLTPADLNIYLESKPDFSKHSAQLAPRTATLPFASYEILSNHHYCLSTRKRAVIMHDSIHDMESFFWVLLYLCLTRKGPGGGRRDELQNGNTGGPACSLEQIVYCFFDADDRNILASNRLLLFEQPEDLEEHITKQFHPYFEPLKQLVIDWWRLLCFAYTVSSYDPMHQSLLDVIDRTITKHQGSLTPTKETRAELLRRKKDLSHLENFRRMQRDASIRKQQSAPPVVLHPETSPFRVHSRYESYRDPARSSSPPSPTVLAKKLKAGTQ